MKIFHIALALSLAVAPLVTVAQDVTGLNSGLNFANSIAPTSKGQVVNPSAVNGQAWSTNGGGTAVPTSTPSGLGSFSNPPSSSSSFSTNNFMGSLSGLGTKAMTDCANYVPTGDKIADQRCAAINFMSAHCLTPTSGQNSILHASAASQGSLSNCQNTYGAGASQFDYGNTVKRADTIFGPIANSVNDARNQPQNCTQQTVVTSPAQYTTNTCVKSGSVDNPRCSQSLYFTVTPAQAGSCADQVGPQLPYFQNNRFDANNTNGGLLQTENYLVLNGSAVWTTSQYTGVYYTDMIGKIVTATNGNRYMILNDVHRGMVTQGGNFNVGFGIAQVTLVCTPSIPASATTSWKDDCTALESSAGAMLGTP